RGGNLTARCQMLVSIIAAMDRSGLIGNEHGLPWRLPMDLKRFRDLTRGKPVIMGRKTHELIGGPLKERENLLLTHRSGYTATGGQVAHSLAEALTIARSALQKSGGEEVMVVGGGEVYRQAFPLCERLYLTVVEGEFQGTTYFPIDLLRSDEWH